MQRFIFFVALTFISIGSLIAQKGAISGTILDSDGFELIGANIVVEGTGTGAQTDFDGKYSFQVEPGVYTLVATYIGYADSKLNDIEVKANETTILDIVMEEGGGVQLSEVVVVEKALERSENAVLMLRKKSDKVQDVISAQEISRLGAGDAAAALKKVTGTTIVDGKYVYVRGLGDRYSATSLNGLRLPSIDPYRNSAQLDLIPTNLLDNIVASKTFTPDLPGDFTGGSVNIKLKSLPERFMWSVSLSSAFNSQNNMQKDFQTYNSNSVNGLGFQDGSLDLPSLLTDPAADELGAFDPNAGRKARQNDELANYVENSVNALGNNMTASNEESGIDYGIGASIGNQFTLGNIDLGAFATINFSKDYSFYQNGTNAAYNADVGQPNLNENFLLNDTRSEEAPSLGGMIGLGAKIGTATQINFYTIYSHQAFLQARTLQGDYADYGIGGEGNHFFSQTQTYLERELMDYVLQASHTLKKLNNARLEWAANYIKSGQNEPDIRFFAYGYENERYDISASQFTLPSRFWRELNDDAYQGKVDFTLPILQDKNKANSIKVGGAYYQKDRDFDENQFMYGQRFEQDINEVNGDANAYFAADNTGIIGGESGQNRIGLFLVDNSLLSNSYTGSYQIASAYAMGTFQLTNKLKFIGGLRAEQTNIEVESDVVANEIARAEASGTEVNQEVIDKNQAIIDTLSLLPAANFVYALSENTNLRVSATQTIARPNMREVAPFGSLGFIGDPPTFGNPNLKTTRITNLDVRYEIFPKAGEVLAISAFYKHFVDPIVVTFRSAGSPQYTWENTEDGELYGAEIEVRKNMDFLTPALEDFSVSANFAYINSNVKIDEKECQDSQDVDPNFECERQFAGQSPFIANVNLSYQNTKDLDVILAYNFFGDRLTAVGQVGTPDVFEKGRGNLDFSISKKFNRLKATFRAKNLLDPNYRRFTEFNGQEYIFRNYTRGREFSFGLSYSL